MSSKMKLSRLPSDQQPLARSPAELGGSDGAGAGESDWLERVPSREDSPLLNPREDSGPHSDEKLS